MTEKKKRVAGSDIAAAPGVVEYSEGLENEYRSETLLLVVPRDQNSPQQATYGLYAELISGTTFATPRCRNLRTWMYRVYPSCYHDPPTPVTAGYELFLAPATKQTPQQILWKPFPLPDPGINRNFLEGLTKLATAGDPSTRTGMSLYFYSLSVDMQRRALMNHDGDFLIIPQHGALTITTEMGVIEVEPQEVAVIPRGIKFTVDKKASATGRGYICEVYDGHFQLPERGIIGTTGLAERQHFLVPTAAMRASDDVKWTVFMKFNNTLWSYRGNCPYDVAGWRGTYYPFKYDLRKFNPLNTVGFDHIDPSIFTVLQVPKGVEPGVSAVDFMAFPPRWSVADHTFRPPYFHRNNAAEFSGLITGPTDAGTQTLRPGGATLHNTMAAHGPNVDVFNAASQAALVPQHVDDNTMGFMISTCYTLGLTDFGADPTFQNINYYKGWTFPKVFDPRDPDAWAHHYNPPPPPAPAPAPAAMASADEDDSAEVVSAE